MNLAKLRRQHVIILGSVVCIIVGVGLFYLLIKPMNAQIADVDAKYTASKTVADRLPSAQQQLAQAMSEVNRNQAQYAQYEISKMPNLSFAQRDRGMLDLWNEQILVLGPILEKWASTKGVKLTSDFEVPVPTTNPNELPTEFIELPIGKVTVEGSFKSIMSHIREWNNCPRLVKIDKPQLSGTSPVVTGSYELTVYIFPRGSAGPQIQMAGGAAGTGGPGVPGAPGGAPGSVPPPVTPGS